MHHCGGGRLLPLLHFAPLNCFAHALRCFPHLYLSLAARDLGKHPLIDPSTCHNPTANNGELQAGHAVHEDEADRTAELLLEFVKRFRIGEPPLTFTKPQPPDS